MRTSLLAAALILSSLALPAAAEVLSLSPANGAPAPVNLPQRGASQTEVAQAFGAPQTRHAPVGGGSPQQPPITRWDYAGYSVFFERDKVIDVVVKDRPARVHHMDELLAQP